MFWQWGLFYIAIVLAHIVLAISVGFFDCGRFESGVHMARNVFIFGVWFVGPVPLLRWGC